MRISLFDLIKNRFNRYMVECEFKYIINYYNFFYSFNRYMVECEYGRGLA